MLGEFRMNEELNSALTQLNILRIRIDEDDALSENEKVYLSQLCGQVNYISWLLMQEIQQK